MHSMWVGLTGGIATGKSTVTGFLRELGAKVLDADQVARDVVKPGQPAWREIREAFGQQYFLPDGQLDRPKLGRLVFGDQKARALLESIIHPAVFRSMEAEAEALVSSGHSIVIFDIPLLFESGYDKKLDCNVVVYAERDEQLRRLMVRDRLDTEAAKERIEAQMPIEDKVALADYTIDNMGTLEETREQVRDLWCHLKKKVGETIEDSANRP